MAFEPYLSERHLGCYKASKNSCLPNPALDPNCGECDEYKQLTQDRWNVLRSDPCQRSPLDDLIDPCGTLKTSLNALDNAVNGVASNDIATKTSYQKHYNFPLSHNNVDDCCKFPCCPCVDQFPRRPKNLEFRCSEPPVGPCEPFIDLTTYKSFYVQHPPTCPPQKRFEQWRPTDCPMEGCSITKTDYCPKTRIPNGPPCAEIIKHGMWSKDQFDLPFTEATTTLEEFGPKFACPPKPYSKFQNLGLSTCPMERDTITKLDYGPKPIEPRCYPDWIENDSYYKPEINMDSCTTYKHFYRPHKILPAGNLCAKVPDPGAIPFCTMNNLCYTCHDPVIDQRPPVICVDNDPWPYVKPSPVKYQDNLFTHPELPFRDATTYNADYWAKALCRPNIVNKPYSGWVKPIIPINDDTTMKTAFRAYTRDEYKNALGNSGNPNGIDWGPYRCAERNDKCLPRFPAPYGNPLKPFLNSRCPCGPFDDRSTYNQAFQFRSPEVVDKLEAEMCRVPDIPRGSSLSRHDYIIQGGKRAERMPPPISKGYRCMHPCSLQNLDTDYRENYDNFWNSMERQNLELYRGKPTIRTRRGNDADGTCGNQEEIIYTPVFVKAPPKVPYIDPCQAPGKESKEVGSTNIDLTGPEYQRCKEIPYSGQDILNRAQESCVPFGYK